MEKFKYIRLNNNNNHLSIGNLFRIIKEEANNKYSSSQAEIFCILFNLDDISDTTVNNYCTGVRAINLKFKNIYIDLKKDYQRDKTKLIEILFRLLNVIDINNNFKNANTPEQYIEGINCNQKIYNICLRLYNIAKNDAEVSNIFCSTLKSMLDRKNLADFFIEVLFFMILEKKQPIYTKDNFINSIDSFLYNSSSSSSDAIDFINAQLKSGLSSIRYIQELAIKGNPYACFEMGSLELYGYVSGKPRYQQSFNFYKSAADKNHPNAIWALGHLYYNGLIGSKSRDDMKKAFLYFNKSRKMNCSASLNSLGIIYKNGDIPFIKKDLSKAKKLFKLAFDMDYIYASNNLGSILLEENNHTEAFKYFKYAADHGESWASNKVGECYRKGIGVKRNIKEAYSYYNKSSESVIYSLCPWSKYNLAHYFYKDGNPEIGIAKNIPKSIELLEEAISGNILEAYVDLIQIYYNLYIENGDKNSLVKCQDYINLYIAKANDFSKDISDICNKLQALSKIKIKFEK